MASTDNRNREIYEAGWAAWRDMKLYGPASVWLRELIAAALDSLDAARVASILDVGCGEGTTTDMLARKFPRAAVTGIDFSEAGIAMARESYGSARVTFLADTASAQLEERRFDLVTCFEVLEHVDDWQSLLARICRAAGYAVALSFPTGRMRPYEAHVGHVRNFRKGEVEPFLREAGFEVARRFYAGFPFFSPIYRDLCNLVDAGSSDFSTGRFGARQKAVSALLLAMFRHFSLRSVGDQFCGVFVRAGR